MAVQPGACVLRRILVVVADQRNTELVAVRHQHRMLVAAGEAPAREHVEQVGLAQQVGLGHELRRVFQPWQAELGRGLVDQRTGHEARVVALVPQQPDHEEHHQRREHEQRHETPDGLARNLVHASPPASLRGASGSDFVRSAPGSTARRKRKRLSNTTAKPPSIISTPPPQIQRTNGLSYTRSDHAPPPIGSPSDTYRSRNTPASIAASVCTCPPAYVRFCGCRVTMCLPLRVITTVPCCAR